jgi:hypothetical protein
MLGIKYLANGQSFDVTYTKGVGFENNVWYTYKFVLDEDNKSYGINPSVWVKQGQLNVEDYPAIVDGKYTFYIHTHWSLGNKFEVMINRTLVPCTIIKK